MREVLEWYLHAKVQGNEIVSATDVEVRSNTFNMKDFWAVVRNEAQSEKNVIFKGKKKDLLKPVFEHTLDIVYKCLESRVAGVDDVNAEKVGLISAILNNFKCDWPKHIYGCLEYYGLKAAVKERDVELKVNVGYRFMLAYLLKLKGVSLKPGSEIHPHT